LPVQIALNDKIPGQMKAVVYTRYGSPEVLQLKKIKKPLPGDDEVLVKICATTVNSGDLRMRKADPFAIRILFGLFSPRKKVLGFSLSGVVEAVGKNIKQFKAGDEVFGSTGFGFGAWAEYKCLPEKLLVRKPANISYEESAAIPFGGLTALYYLKKAAIQPGQNVLVYGASGSTGAFAVQLAKHFGAIVTAVCSTANVEWMPALGADKIIDYKKKDFTSNETRYDMVFDAVGKLSSNKAKKILNRNGKYLSVSRGLAKTGKDDLLMLRDLAANGTIKPVIDKVWPLEAIAEANRYADKGHKKGNIVITVSHS
jgi:NADPH:quinone reductase-like Zn-dependent oxidoreductase